VERPTERPAERRIVVVGASWGGLSALGRLVAGLPADFPFPVAVIQHRSRDAGNLLAELLQDSAALHVCEVEDKDPIEPGQVYVAPPDYHLLVDGPYFSLTVDPHVRYSRPSIDVTFTSAAASWAAQAVGVVLTGANEDGALGLRRIVERGGTAVVQDPATAEIPTMPAAARALVPTARVLPVEEIPDFLLSLAGREPVANTPADPRAAARGAGRAGTRPSLGRGAP
jgi:two-component system, chemotaxis family, protein-glutamate methylesterase/glutaminase